MALRLLANPSRHGWGLHQWCSSPSLSNSISASRRLTALQRQFSLTSLQPIFSLKEAISSSSIVPRHEAIDGLSSWEPNENLGGIRPPRGRLKNGGVRRTILNVASEAEDRIIAYAAVRRRGGYGLALVLKAAEKEEWFCVDSGWRLRMVKPEGRSWRLVEAKLEVRPRQQPMSHRSAGVKVVATMVAANTGAAAPVRIPKLVWVPRSLFGVPRSKWLPNVLGFGTFWGPNAAEVFIGPGLVSGTSIWVQTP